MILSNIFSKQQEAVVSNPSIDSARILENDCFNIFNSTINTDWNYFYHCYLNCTVLNTAVGWVVNHANQIEIKNFTKIHDVWWTSYLVTGNLFLLQFKKGVYTYIETKDVSIINKTYKLTGLTNNFEFDANGDGIGNPYKLIHLKNKGLETKLDYGYSFIQPIMNDVEILMCGGNHNVALLKNGATPNAIVSSQERMEDSTWDKFKQGWRERFEGARNAGKLAFLNGGGFDYKAIQLSNKDMEYSVQLSRSEIAVYKQFKMPLPLIETSKQTYSNYSEAQAQLYENMIIPIFYSIIDQLKKILKDDKIVLDVENLPVQAKTLLTKMATEMNKSGVLTINEVRRAIGYADLIGGDIIRSNTTQPIAYANDDFSDENLFPKDSANE